ncbi:MAG TPA: hypothetical protein VGO87_09390, partial [Acidimicrobiia bacterium]
MDRMLGRSRRAVIGALLATATVAGVTGVAGQSAPLAVAATGCQLGNGIQHVIHLTFDNVHFFRDNPNVPSDLEQMPNLLNFFLNNGVLMSNNHTPLIAHTADDSLTQYSGLYGDRHGMGVSNSFEYSSGPAVTSADSFVYWTSPIIDHGPQTPSTTDHNPSMIYSATVPATPVPTATPGVAAAAPAPWVPWTRAGCDVGDVSTANMVLEKFADIPTVFGPNSPEAQQLADDTTDPSFKDPEIDDYIGLSLHCGQTAGVNSPRCTNAEAVKYNHSTANHLDPVPSPTAIADKLPDEPGGYNGFEAVHGHRYLQPILSGGGAGPNPNVVHSAGGHSYPVTDAAGNLLDLNGLELDGAFPDHNDGVAANPSKFNAGFPGFSPTAAQSLAYVADMQEAGVPVTYMYISDAHDKKRNIDAPGFQTGCTSPGNALGPGDPCYKANLASYDAAFGKFFQRLADDGITPANTLFMFSAEENDHFAGADVGRALTPTCTGTPGGSDYQCSYNATTAPVGEVSVNIHTLLANQQGDTTPFYSEPQGESVYVTGGADDATIRQLQRHWGAATANNPYAGDANQPIVDYMADPTVEQLLHFTNADPNRTPSFTVFPKGDYFFSGGLTDSCGTGVTPGPAPAGNANTKCSSINSGFAWNHGYYQPEIDITWLGMAGPGVAHRGLDGPPATHLVTQEAGVPANSTVGTWVDHTDIRPTMLALAGLKDDYTPDGRVLVENLTAKPGHSADPLYQPLATCYKQLNASVGRFGNAVLVADTAALKSGSPDQDRLYSQFSHRLAVLGRQRDSLATRIK